MHKMILTLGVVGALLAAGCETPSGETDRTATGALAGGVLGPDRGVARQYHRARGDRGADRWRHGGAHRCGDRQCDGPATAANPGAANPQTLQRVDQGQPLGLADIKALARAGVSDEVIISQIRSSRTVYRLSTAEIIDLKDAGVSERVIDFMINTPSLYPPPRRRRRITEVVEDLLPIRPRGSAILGAVMPLLYTVAYAIGFLVLRPVVPLQDVETGQVPENFFQRFGLYAAPLREQLTATGQRCCWIQAVSVGEVNVALVLIAALRQAWPQWRLVLSTTTSTGYALARARLPAEVVLVYFPQDFPPCVRRAYDLIHPDVMVLMESEVWPNHVWEAARRQVPWSSMPDSRRVRRAATAGWAGCFGGCLANWRWPAPKARRTPSTSSHWEYRRSGCTSPAT